MHACARLKIALHCCLFARPSIIFRARRRRRRRRRFQRAAEADLCAEREHCEQQHKAFPLEKARVRRRVAVAVAILVAVVVVAVVVLQWAYSLLSIYALGMPARRRAASRRR